MPHLNRSDAQSEAVKVGLALVSNPPHDRELNEQNDRAPHEKPPLDLDKINSQLANATAEQVIEWASQSFGDGLVMSTSFGIQAAVMLDLATQIVPDLPIIWVDTGYLPAETYQFAEQLIERLNLNMKVYQSPISPARMEAIYGRLWAQNDLESLNRYDKIRKVEPMQRALKELKATAWLAGLRSDQTNHRKMLQRIDVQGEQYKILPILAWNAKDVYEYLTARDLPYHPFFDLGYVSVGDWHSSRPLMAEDTDERDTRFHGLKQECGLHLPRTPGEAQSLDSSTL
ncbi:phosphoadenosine phosphosulfate reductase [Candidatus Gracilibacteria bacterium]|nr:phosphoadenosine phosphosulfate reductase [Candidatus Gracilibacteria bacterium]NJM87781.1 phosphoadenosine phosphosulfate reductase [Hydrococcus sp. RU_2_2]NJP18418.1 phosphoadenosine phosphosulfate reductase [Hydrococcus sp. CRU_1_1]